MREINLLSDQVRQTAYEIHAYHRHGHLEKIYENALAHRLRKAGLDAKQQHPIEVLDEVGTILGEYYADLCVERDLIIEVKAAKSLATEHEAQILGYLLGYLKSCRIKHGHLIKFWLLQIRNPEVPNGVGNNQP
jgi:GxxExxY protein